MRILLTGGAGTIGRYVIDELIKKGYSITVLDIRNKKTFKVLRRYKNKINVIYGSITDIEVVRTAVLGQDVIIHLAGLIPPYADLNKELTNKVNYGGTKNIVDTIKEINSKCFLIFASSISVYGDRLNNYNISINDKCIPSIGDYYAKVKLKTEELIIKSNINYTIFRLSAIMDVNKIDPLMFHMPLETKLEISTARDTAKAFVYAIDKLLILNKNIYNLGGGESCRITYKEFLKKCFSIYGLNYKYLDEKAFATKNFHCGYYVDSYILNNILNYRSDTLNDYYSFLKKEVSLFKKISTKILSYFILRKLNKESEPRIAKEKNDKTLINKYFR